MTSTLVERKFVRQQEKYSLVEKKELGELDKNVSPRLFRPHAYFILLYFPPTHLIWYLKQFNDFTLKFSISGCFSSEKQFLNLYTMIVFSFPLGACVDDVVNNLANYK